MRKDMPLTLGYFLARAGRFLLMLFLFALSFCVVFEVAAYSIAALVESRNPGAFETPLSAAGPLLAGGFITVLLHIAVLAFLAYRRVPFAKFFLTLISVSFVSVIAVWYIDSIAAQHFNGWYPAGSSPAPEYPVLVITPDQQPGSYQARVIQWSQLEKFCQQNPEYSFLVPEGQDSDLLSQMPGHNFQWARAHDENADAPVSAKFEVTRLGKGRQKLIVSGAWYRTAMPPFGVGMKPRPTRSIRSI
jgi:hypothetical protein